MDDDALLSAVRAAHGIDRAPRHARREALSLDRIVDAAVAIADAEGLAAVSMARIASGLGFTPMALYRHVSSKDELITHMQDAALSSPPTSLTEIGDWREGLRQWTGAHLAVTVAHPWTLEIPISGPPLMPNALAWMEVAMNIMAELPLRGMEKLALLTLLVAHARNEANIAVNMRQAANESGISADDEATAYENALKGILDVERFPFLHTMVASGELIALPPEIKDQDAYYTNFPVELILNGVAISIQERQGPHV